MADSESTPGEGRRTVLTTRSKNIVCTSCRQSKVRCIGYEKQSCGRCIRLGLDCHRDPGFKRVSKSRKIAELEEQVQLLASAVNSPIRQSANTSQSSSAATRHMRSSYDNFFVSNFGIQAGVWQQPQQIQPQRDPSVSVTIDSSPVIQDSFNGSIPTELSGACIRPPAVIPRTIETLQLTPSQIDILFQVFFEHYHPFLPFLDPSKSPDDYYKSGFTIFWTIIGVASRRYREDVTLLTVLSDWVMKLIWSEISKPPYKVSTVQAVILLCIWPFPTSTTWTGISATLSATALSAAMQVGLHQPLNTQDFSRTRANEIDLKMITRTWAAANIVSQFSAAVSGQLPNAPFDSTIDRACKLGNMYTLPDAFRYKLIIQTYCHRVNKTMCSISYDLISPQSPPLGEPSSFTTSWKNDMAALESELDSIEQEISSQFSATDQLYLAAARLYLHSFHFFSFESSPLLSRRAGILKAYNSAITLVSLFNFADSTSESLLYLPYYHFRSLLTAACVLIKFLKSSYAAELDFEAGRKAFNDSILALSKSSVSNNDTGGKAVKLLSQMWHGGAGTKNSPPELMIKSRFGASITYDFIWSWRKEFGGLPRNNTAPSNDLPTQDIVSGFSQDATMFDMDFLADPGWNVGFGDVSMFGGTGV